MTSDAAAVQRDPLYTLTQHASVCPTPPLPSLRRRILVTYASQMAQAQLGQPTIQPRQPQDAASSTIADRARELGAVVMSGPAFERWMRGLEATNDEAGGTPRAGKVRHAVKDASQWHAFFGKRVFQTLPFSSRREIDA